MSLSSHIATRPWEIITWHPAVSPSIHHPVITRLSHSHSRVITETRHVFVKTRTETKTETKKQSLMEHRGRGTPMYSRRTSEWCLVIADVTTISHACHQFALYYLHTHLLWRNSLVVSTARDRLSRLKYYVVLFILSTSIHYQLTS
jgi:hypothetical protein